MSYAKFGSEVDEAIVKADKRIQRNTTITDCLTRIVRTTGETALDDWKTLIDGLKEAKKENERVHIPVELLGSLLESALQQADKAAEKTIADAQQHPIKQWENDAFAKSLWQAEQWLESRGLL